MTNVNHIDLIKEDERQETMYHMTYCWTYTWTCRWTGLRSILFQQLTILMLSFGLPFNKEESFMIWRMGSIIDSRKTVARRATPCFSSIIWQERQEKYFMTFESLSSLEASWATQLMIEIDSTLHNVSVCRIWDFIWKCFSDVWHDDNVSEFGL